MKGSDRSVWWVCPAGHEYLTYVYSRTGPRRNGCPVCSGQKVLVGYNDLATVCPEIAAEWHPTKNGNLTPADVTKGSTKSVLWQCPLGHEYSARVNDRTKPNKAGCPFCSGKKVLVGYNDLATLCPEIATEWHPTKNGDLKPTDVTRGSNEPVWWQCPLGHEWKATVNERTGSQKCGCPYCSTHRVLSGYNDLATLSPEIAAEWHPTKNGELKPSDVAKRSREKVWWKCPLGHEWKATVASRTGPQKCGCPYCSEHRVPPEESISQKYPDLLQEWDFVNNYAICDPIMVGENSQHPVWWHCKNDPSHKYLMSPKNRILFSKRSREPCPLCKGRRRKKNHFI